MASINLDVDLHTVPPPLQLFYIQEVVVDFEAHAISASDFNGIKKLLQQVLHNFPVLHLNYDVGVWCDGSWRHVMFGNSSSWRLMLIYQRWQTSSFSRITLEVSSRWVLQILDDFSAVLNMYLLIPSLCCSKLRCQKTAMMKIPMKCLVSSPCSTLRRGR